MARILLAMTLSPLLIRPKLLTIQLWDLLTQTAIILFGMEKIAQSLLYSVQILPYKIIPTHMIHTLFHITVLMMVISHHQIMISKLILQHLMQLLRIILPKILITPQIKILHIPQIIQLLIALQL